MKSLFITLLLLITISPTLLKGQDYIYKTNGDKIRCLIFDQDSLNVYYTITKGDDKIDTYLSRTEILSISLGNKKIPEFVDTLISLKNNTKIPCHIEKEDAVGVYAWISKNNQVVKKYFDKADVKIKSSADFKPQNSDIASLGLGLGRIYGGYGLNLLYYPQKNIGLFAGAGYAIIKPGYNLGMKLRLISKGAISRTDPFIEAMYGYNIGFKIKNLSSKDKLFYGFTLGIGFDYRRNYNNSLGYWSFAVNFPFISKEAYHYKENLEDNYDVSFDRGISLVGFSIGYRLLIK
jgi:hypothetical protein